MISCLCPTWRRPKLLQNSLACFLAQEYQGPRELLILDDAYQYPDQVGPNWELVSVRRRFHSLSEKFNALVGMARGDVLVIWEDDDVQLPHFLTTIADAARRGPGLYKPSRVWSNYDGLKQEDATGRFHGSMAFHREVLTQAGGWPLTRAANFDQQLIARLQAVAPVVIDTTELDERGPGFVFRWGNGYFHCQGLMRSPTDETWYTSAAEKGDGTYVDTLIPEFDATTTAICRQLCP